MHLTNFTAPYVGVPHANITYDSHWDNFHRGVIEKIDLPHIHLGNRSFREQIVAPWTVLAKIICCWLEHDDALFDLRLKTSKITTTKLYTLLKASQWEAQVVASEITTFNS